MQQRVMIAMALVGDPELLILDEPTTGLDVTTEAVILDLIRGLIAERDTGVVYITHNLGVVAQLCERVTVLYAGEIMEDAPVDDLFYRSHHPYTLGLLNSLPHPGQDKRLELLHPIEGNPPALTQSRAPDAPSLSAALMFLDRCREEKPPLESLARWALACAAIAGGKSATATCKLPRPKWARWRNQRTAARIPSCA